MALAAGDGRWAAPTADAGAEAGGFVCAAVGGAAWCPCDAFVFFLLIGALVCGWAVPSSIVAKRSDL